MKLQLGQRVRYTSRLGRFTDLEAVPKSPDKQWVKRWRPLPDSDGEGIVVGLRTLQEGWTDSWTEGDELGSYTIRQWMRLGTVKVALVAHNLRDKPAYVAIGDVEVVDS